MLYKCKLSNRLWMGRGSPRNAALLRNRHVVERVDPSADAGV